MYIIAEGFYVKKNSGGATGAVLALAFLGGTAEMGPLL
jgi:hypothetical protein